MDNSHQQIKIIQLDTILKPDVRFLLNFLWKINLPVPTAHNIQFSCTRHLSKTTLKSYKITKTLWTGHQLRQTAQLVAMEIKIPLKDTRFKSNLHLRVEPKIIILEPFQDGSKNQQKTRIPTRWKSRHKIVKNYIKIKPPLNLQAVAKTKFVEPCLILFKSQRNYCKFPQVDPTKISIQFKRETWDSLRSRVPVSQVHRWRFDTESYALTFEKTK